MVKFSLFLLLIVFDFGKCIVSEDSSDTNLNNSDYFYELFKDEFHLPIFSPVDSEITHVQGFDPKDISKQEDHDTDVESNEPRPKSKPDIKIILAEPTENTLKLSKPTLLHPVPSDTKTSPQTPKNNPLPDDTEQINTERINPMQSASTNMPVNEDKVITGTEKSLNMILKEPLNSTRSSQTSSTSVNTSLNHSTSPSQDDTTLKSQVLSKSVTNQFAPNIINNSNKTTVSSPSTVTTSCQTDLAPTDDDDALIHSQSVTNIDVNGKDDGDDSQDYQKNSDSENTRSMLIKLQKILLVLAGVTFLCILIYSIYYINLIRSIYSKERVSK